MALPAAAAGRYQAICTGKVQGCPSFCWPRESRPFILVRMSEETLLVLSTCPVESAEALASSVVESGLAACVNIHAAVRSVYRWEGKVQIDKESLLMIKCTRSRLDALKAQLLSLHPYELPEIIAVPITGGHAPYLDWVRDHCS